MVYSPAARAEKHPRIGEYVRANWSGEPTQLPQVLEGMLAEGRAA